MTLDIILRTGIEVMLCFVDIILLDFYCGKLATKKDIPTPFKAVVAILTAGLLYFATNTLYSNEGTIFSLLLMLTYAFVLFEGSNTKRVFAVFGYYVLSGIVTLLVTSLASWIFGISYVELLQQFSVWVVVALMIKLVMLMIGIVLSTTLLPTQTRRENLIGIAQYLGVSFIVLVLLYDYLFINALTHIENIIILMTLTYVVSFALILALITRYFKEKNERMLMESALFEANQKNEAYIQSVQDKIETAKLKHDLKNHLITLQSFIENDMNEESLRYIQTLHALPELKSYVNTNNLTINAILNSKISSYPNIRFKVRHDEGRFAIPHDKLTIILGNALDNAINETLLYAHDPKEIQIVISENHQYIKIYIANKISHPVTMVDGKPINKSGKRVGLGVDNILDAVKFLNGRAMFTSEGDTFQFKALIPLSNKQRIK